MDIAPAAAQPPGNEWAPGSPHRAGWPPERPGWRWWAARRRGPAL